MVSAERSGGYGALGLTLVFIRSYPVRSLLLTLLFLLGIQYLVNAAFYQRYILVGKGRWVFSVDHNDSTFGYIPTVQTPSQASLLPETLVNSTPIYISSVSNLVDSNFTIDNLMYNASSFHTTAAQPTSLLPLCPLVPPDLVGNKFKPNTDKAYTWEEIKNQNPNISHGGWFPSHCEARDKVAIIIPYRNRDVHLRIFLSNIHPFLVRQQLNYKIFIVEQTGSTRFNRAGLFNIGFLEAQKTFNASCYVFHDVDLIPEHDHNMYRCGRFPRHMSAAVDKFGYKLPYRQLFGGVCAISRDQFVKMNGYSNVFFGWGGEDDDLSNRVHWAGFKISRYKMELAKYKMIKHKAEKGNKPNPLRWKLIKNGKQRWKKDGLTSALYSVNNIEDRGLVIWLTVEIPEHQIISKWNLLANQSSPKLQPMTHNLLVCVSLTLLPLLYFYV